MRLEQVVAGGELERHARGAPDVGGRAVAGADEHLKRAVLPRLDVLSEVVVRPARVAQVRELHEQLVARALLAPRLHLPPHWRHASARCSYATKAIAVQ